MVAIQLIASALFALFFMVFQYKEGNYKMSIFNGFWLGVVVGAGEF